MRANLHIHTFASDGTDSPKEILELAKGNDIDVIAVCDHNSVDSQKELNELSAEYGVKVINGVEIDCILNGKSYHVLGLGIDYKVKELVDFVKSVRSTQLANNRKLIEKMCSDFDEINLEDYDSYEHNPFRGGWKTITYLQDRGVVKDLYSVFGYYEEYDCPQSKIKFPDANKAIDIIHKAGGYAVLAHPGEYARRAKDMDLGQLLSDFNKIGIDGIESYYPKHSDVVTGLCLDFCREHDLMITGGTDYHGTFVGGNAFDAIEIDLDKLKVDRLLR